MSGGVPLKVFAPPGELADLLEAVRRPLDGEEIASLTQVPHHDGPVVVVMSRALLKGMSPEEWEALPPHAALVSTDTQSRGEAEKAGRLFIGLEDLERGRPGAVARALRAAARHSAALLAEARASASRTRIEGKLAQLNRVGMALMSERDPDVLLGLILSQARDLTGSDAGSLYLVEGEGEERRLHFLRAQNDSLPGLPQPDFTLPLDQTSVAGYAATTGEILVLEDAYRIPDGAPYTFNRGFDKEHGYRACSMLVAPMVDHRDRVVGVLQLINRKREGAGPIRGEEDVAAHVLPYTEAEVNTVRSLAGQAAVSIENGRLYQDIERLFEGFIKAAVTAIDQRDPSTAGHSVRVTALTCDLAELINEAESGPFAGVTFSREQMRELRYAGLLHDFGKVGVREEVLVKSKKLPPVMRERVHARFNLIRRTLESDFHRKQAEFLLEQDRDAFPDFLAELTQEYEASLRQLDEFERAVWEANEPRVLQEASAGVIHELGGMRFRGPGNEEAAFLREEELHFLSIPRGNLDEDERLQIQSHVDHSYNFLLQIPWTDDLADVAEIVVGHHEKLDGTGYPRGTRGEHLPLQTRIMAVADIFDALTASDRPYKRALSTDRALEILRMEADAGQLDADVVDLLVASGVYRKVVETDWREL
jgi:HD-GYP domain-containing protein (c-di-GMP phosphodiesterase class II)